MRELTRDQRNTFFACFGGLALDAMDTSIYALAIPALIATAGITKQDAGMIASLFLIGAGFGGWFGGALADRFGRIRMLQATVLWVALFTFASAFTHGFVQLASTRVLQGIGYGAEVAIGGVLMSEAVSPALRGRVAAAVQSGYAIGYGLAVAAAPLIFALAPEHLAWRLFFGLGLIPAAFVVFIRRLVPETQTFLKAEKPKALDLVSIFRPQHLGRTLTATIMATGVFGGAYTLLTWLPTYLRVAKHLSVMSTSGYLAANIFGSFVGPLLFGQVAERIGRRATFIGFLALQAINVGVYVTAPIGMGTMLVLGAVMGALQGGLASGMLPAFAEIFPTPLRATGEGFCLSGGRGFGAVVPALVGFYAATAPLGLAMGLGAIASYAVGVAAVAVLPDTRKQLVDLAA
jgi:MFS family permease